MELILWRHAEAADTLPDMARELTRKGQRQAHDMAAWLSGQLSGPVRVVASPAARTLQTAEALGRDIAVVPQIDPDGDADALLAASGWPDSHGVVILVGHNPAISELAARLAGANTASLSLGRAAAWWFTGSTDGTVQSLTLKSAMTPALLHRAR